jgi:uncharacterized protein (TIGR03067 family)
MGRPCYFALSVVLLVLGSSAAAVPQQADKKTTAKDLQPLQGTWQQVSVLSNGQQEDFVKGQEPILTIRDDTYTVQVNGKQLEAGVLKIGPPARPRTIDLVATDGDKKGRTYPGIYEVSGNTLRACLARDDVARPSEFAARAGSGLFVAVYRRADPKK